MKRHARPLLGLALGGVLAMSGTATAQSAAAQSPAAQAPAPATPSAAPQTAAPPTAPQAAAPAQAAPAQAPPIAPMEESRRVQADDIDTLLADGKTLLLDVREPKEIQELGTIEGSINIPLGQLEQRMGELPKDKLILTA